MPEVGDGEISYMRRGRRATSHHHEMHIPFTALSLAELRLVAVVHFAHVRQPRHWHRTSVVKGDNICPSLRSEGRLRQDWQERGGVTRERLSDYVRHRFIRSESFSDANAATSLFRPAPRSHLPVTMAGSNLNQRAESGDRGQRLIRPPTAAKGLDIPATP